MSTLDIRTAIGEPVRQNHILLPREKGKIKFKKSSKREALNPIVQSDFISDESRIFIQAKILAPGKITRWSIYQQVILSSAGQVQLNIYVRNFNQIKKIKKYFIYDLSMDVTGENTDAKTQLHVALKDDIFKAISTVEIIMIEGDPITSRGTVTTVQSTG